MAHTDNPPLRDLMWYGPLRPDMTEKGIPPEPGECIDRGSYVATVKEVMKLFNPRALSQFPDNWKMPLYEQQNQFVRDNLAALKAGKAFKVTLVDGSTLYVARSGWKRVASAFRKGVA